ncbi:MAG: MotA/TolQ/ExbB proton channel family protein [Opitutales bacterium]|nr:MotA/TolQ/ExbB proton channel family protein [Opitutales bacterium]MCH8540326.1 MotA/TolQ/ExbB proton channel family protein [Opitutales bacterium]
MFFDLLISPEFPLLLGEASGGIFTYFANSNFAGKIIVLILGFISIVAWTVMVGKFIELSKLDKLNKTFERRLAKESTILQGGVKLPSGVPFAQLYKDALQAFHYADNNTAGTMATDTENLRVSQMENAIQRAVANSARYYESRMVPLASIVTGAPFLGLLGTVWGVMDAFGSVALSANVTLQMLAPGVSGALLTTVAALVVAIPSVFGYNLLLGKNRAMITDLENFASHLADRIELEYQQQHGEDL